MADGFKALRVIERLARRAGCDLKMSPLDHVDATIDAIELWLDEDEARRKALFRTSWIKDRTHNLMIDSRRGGFWTGVTEPLTVDGAKAKAERDYEQMLIAMEKDNED